LINARSYSDAEIFPAGWRALALGPIVGIDTGGAVIGTSGFSLIDGSYVRLPVEGWWELDQRNLEQSGTPPDYYVDVDPDELKAGYDAQLAKAVELLLAELK
jgi:tricorn protease